MGDNIFSRGIFLAISIQSAEDKLKRVLEHGKTVKSDEK